jgi:hypothetical protein
VCQFDISLRALAFFVAGSDLHATTQLIGERLDECDGRDSGGGGRDARRQVSGRGEAALPVDNREHSRPSQRQPVWLRGARCAVRDVRNCESLASQLPEDAGIEGHDAFMARLRREHGRKSKFWELVREGA